MQTTDTQTSAWFVNEEDWVLKRSIIFNTNLVRLTFIEVARLLKLLGETPANAPVLDLCCGIGRHTLELARRGFQVTAVDITKPYLEIAKEYAKKDGLDIEFVHSDMKLFIRPQAYELIINLCTSFGYFDDIADDLLVLKNMYDSLKPSGKFVLEILGKEVIAATFSKVQELEYDGYKVIARSRILENWSRLECKRLITYEGEQKEITAYHRLYSYTELRNHLSEVGFKNIQAFGDFNGAPYDSDAKSLILICEK